MISATTKLRNKEALRGVWWRPERSAVRHFGELGLDEVGLLRLDLVGDQGTVRFPWRPALDPAPTIPALHGVTENGQLATLLACHSPGPGAAGSSRHRHVYVSQRFHIGTALLGIHVDPKTDLNFDAAHVQVSNLRELVGEIAIRDNLEPATGGYLLKFDPPPPIHVELDDSRLTISHGFGTSGASWFDRSIQQTIDVAFELHQPAPLKWIQDSLVWPLIDFVTFSTMAASDADALRVVKGRRCTSEADEIGSVYIVDVIPSARFGLDPGSRNTEFGRHFLRHEHVRDRLAQLLPRWWKLHDELRDPIVGFLYLHRNTGLPVSYRLTTLMQVLEAYHRIRSKHGKRGRGKLDLHVRLRDLFERASITAQASEIDPDKLAKQIELTRNYLVHLNPRGRVRAITHPTAQSVLGDLLAFVFRELIAKDLGLDGKLLETLLWGAAGFGDVIEWTAEMKW